MLDILLSGLAGGVVGGLCSVGAVIVQSRLNRKSQVDAEDRVVQGYLQAIRNEASTLWARYDETVGALITALMPRQPFLGIYPVYQDYFTVYTGNAFILGRVKDDELRALIVKTYTIARGMTDSFRLNNELNQKFENATLMFRQTQMPAFQEYANAYRQALSNYATMLKGRHGELKDHVERLLRAIDNQR